MSKTMERYHLIGIGGMAMSAIAQILLADGIEVTGSDLVMSPLTRRLESLGVRIHAGHDAAHVNGATTVVATAAAKSDNVELVEARRRGIPVLARHEMVARLLQGRIAVAVAGTHGKTTTSTLVALMLQRSSADPTYLLGGESIDLGGNAAAGSGRHIVVEADEYAGAFLAYHPSLAIITNLEPDHLDFYGSERELLRAFRGFADNVRSDGAIVACADSPLLADTLGPAAPAPAAAVIWYGSHPGAEWSYNALSLCEGGGSEFTLVHGGHELVRASLALPGEHNVANAIAAFAIGDLLGLDHDIMLATLATFRGAHRRFELVGEAGGITVVDDYAHHPTEIRATVAAARHRYPGRRIVALFQPHTYSRTRYLLDEFRRCFAETDLLFLLQTFAARETAEAGLDARALAETVEHPVAGFAETVDHAVHLLAGQLRSGDVALTMGAGNVTEVGHPLLQEIRLR